MTVRTKISSISPSPRPKMIPAMATFTANKSITLLRQLDWAKYSDRPPGTADDECVCQIERLTDGIPKERTLPELLAVAKGLIESNEEKKPIANMEWFHRMQKAEEEVWRQCEIPLLSERMQKIEKEAWPAFLENLNLPK